MFAGANPSLIVIVDCEHVTDHELVTTLTGSKPKYVFDIRRVPRFDIGRLTRRAAFESFQAAGAHYIDLTSIHRQNRSSPSPEVIGKAINDALSFSSKGGAIAILVENSQFSEEYITTLLDALPSENEEPWDVFRVPLAPSAAPAPGHREVIFISHANPKDNEFAIWLAQQLTLCGYSVWCDVNNLSAGDRFWEDIENCIRNRCAKVIVVLSKNSQSASGVLDEIDLAIRVERASQLTRFVLPIRLDELSFADVRANLGRKNIIDFHRNWASGLKAIIDVLARDRVPHMDGAVLNALSFGSQKNRAIRVTDRPEQLTSNWLAIRKLPPFVYYYDVAAPLEQVEAIAAAMRTPSFRHLRLIGTFCDVKQGGPSEYSGMLTERYKVDINDFLTGRSTNAPSVKPRDAHNIIMSMLRQAWNKEMADRGLRSFAMASNSLAWYMPCNLLDRNTVTFFSDQKKRRKVMVNWSERRKVFWHFAVEARPSLGLQPRYILRQHVIFTADGQTPLVSKERMHVLRRRFCKSWWNDRWRDLLVGFVAWLNSSPNKLTLDASLQVELDQQLLSFISPLSLDSDENSTDARNSERDDDELTDDDFDVSDGIDDPVSEIQDISEA
ncbi:toll/interleukin-1 receptor domain-containing protein [Bradyrhizobium sp. sGM-13]|uniref:toll/interleukin-1 receptor domain-containing protein n=1 Tax=Bradyrhizobium sp. sGM-13 TaxID=2831781 RepID=UPI001BD16916|nr:toll/interleukin-1 receptor domain-containing protein [Bradyrhizobium sp. sGM-13]